MNFSTSFRHRLRSNALPALVCASLTTALPSCDNKELCWNHWDHALKYNIDCRIGWQLDWQYTYDVSTDWRNLWNGYNFGMSYDAMRPEKPSGVRTQVYTDGHDNINSNIPADGGIVSLTPGEHQILFYNNNTEYIVFNDIDSSVHATATTRTRSRSTYIGNSAIEDHPKENTVNPPDFLFGHYIDNCNVDKPQVAPVVEVTMKPLVFRYLVRYHFDHGLKYVSLARGALAGMAASVYLTDGHTGDEVATVLYDCNVNPWGIEATVNSFGAPNYPNPEYSRAGASYGLNLEVRLTNGHILNFDFDVTDQVLCQPRGGVIEVGGINIPDEIGKEEGGAFNVGIDGWGEYEDIELNF